MSARCTKLAAWLELPDIGSSADLGILKKALAERGVNARGWRIYLDHGDVLFAPLEKHWLDHHSAANKAVLASIWLRLLQSCEMDVPPPLALSESISRWNLPGRGLGHIPPLFLRAAWKATMAAEYSGHNVERFVADEIVPLAQWFFGSGAFRSMTAGQLKAGWESLRDKFREALLTIHKDDQDWPPFLLKVDSSGYRFAALTSEAALELEGQVMAHCIGDYDDRCRNSQLRAWSIREIKSNLHVGSLTVTEARPGEWMIDIIKGPRNSTVDKRVEQAAMGVVWALEDAYAQVRQIRKAMDSARSQAKVSRPVLEDIEDDCCIPF